MFRRSNIRLSPRMRSRVPSRGIVSHRNVPVMVEIKEGCLVNPFLNHFVIARSQKGECKANFQRNAKSNPTFSHVFPSVDSFFDYRQDLHRAFHEPNSLVPYIYADTITMNKQTKSIDVTSISNPLQNFSATFPDQKSLELAYHDLRWMLEDPDLSLVNRTRETSRQFTSPSMRSLNQRFSSHF